MENAANVLWVDKNIGRHCAMRKSPSMVSIKFPCRDKPYVEL